MLYLLAKHYYSYPKQSFYSLVTNPSIIRSNSTNYASIESILQTQPSLSPFLIVGSLFHFPEEYTILT